jgi:hypothetical protein
LAIEKVGITIKKPIEAILKLQFLEQPQLIKDLQKRTLGPDGRTGYNFS